MAKLVDTIIEGTLQVEYDAIVMGELKCGTLNAQKKLLVLGNITTDTTIDCNVNDVISFTVGAPFTLTLKLDIPINTCKEITLIIKNGGFKLLTWPANITWAKTGIKPVLATDKTDVVRLIGINNGLVNWIGTV